MRAVKLKYSAKAHGYWLDGKRCKTPSAIAKVPDDSSALDFWRRRQTAIGLALQPHLLTAIAANADDKKALDAICEEAMTAAGASSGRDYGTAVHKITDLLDGGVFVLETPEVAAIRETWRNLLDAHDLEIVASEQVIVHPDLMVAGRFDRIVRHRASGRLFILDTKTGKSAADFLQSHAVQLWLYASAPLCADGPSGDADFEVAEFVPMHAVSQSVALVAHLPMEGEASIIGVDIAAGRECFERVIRPTWAWRSRSDLRVDDWQTPPLATNLLLLIAVLSLLQATLTLPGIAAIALTLGMAIDANVLINERIREELRNGASPQAAISAGYDRAWDTILDSNITTLIAGIALLVFGSGPVRGFAVVHCLGILTSMFSAVFFSRGLVAAWYGSRRKLAKLSIG
ncbi:MAG: hypothetical protein EBX69_06295 [Betaproteobacteria bacterium]|nr:hypothetical protein [Betaproteobacteria bacterium]